MEGVALYRMIYSTMGWNMHGTYGGTNDERKENKRLNGHRCVMERAHRGIEAHVVLIADNIHRNTGWYEMCREFSLYAWCYMGQYSPSVQVT